jgi:hypothetical protein
LITVKQPDRFFFDNINRHPFNARFLAVIRPCKYFDGVPQRLLRRIAATFGRLKLSSESMNSYGSWRQIAADSGEVVWCGCLPKGVGVWEVSAMRTGEWEGESVARIQKVRRFLKEL